MPNLFGSLVINDWKKSIDERKQLRIKIANLF